MIATILGFIGKYSTKAFYYITGILILVISFLWLWNSRTFYKEYSEKQAETINTLNATLKQKEDALVNYTNIKDKLDKQIKETNKLIEEYKKDENINKWNNISIPDVYINRLRRD